MLTASAASRAAGTVPQYARSILTREGLRGRGRDRDLRRHSVEDH